VQEVADRDEAAASLLAERALNRELNAINTELRANISELGTKLHEVGQCPISRRQEMIKVKDAPPLTSLTKPLW